MARKSTRLRFALGASLSKEAQSGIDIDRSNGSRGPLDPGCRLLRGSSGVTIEGSGEDGATPRTVTQALSRGPCRSLRGMGLLSTGVAVGWLILPQFVFSPTVPSAPRCASPDTRATPLAGMTVRGKPRPPQHHGLSPRPLGLPRSACSPGVRALAAGVQPQAHTAPTAGSSRLDTACLAQG